MREAIGKFIGGQVTAHRKRARWSQAELGDRVGVSRQAVAQWESGELPSFESVYAIAEVFDVEVFDLLPQLRQLR